MKDIRKTMDEGAMAPFQWLAVAICILLIMLDGFDVLVMAFTASAVSRAMRSRVGDLVS